MKKNLKKLIAIALATMATCSVLAGCGSSKNGESSDKSGSSKDVTITYAIWDKNQEPGMKGIVEAFEKKNPNIKVKIEVTPWDQYWTKLEAAATGASLPDVFWMHPAHFVKYAGNNMLMDITDSAKKSKEMSWDNFPKGLVDSYILDGKNYGIPKDYDTIALWYNKSLFDEKKIPYPDETWDWNKLVEVAKKLTDTSKGIYGFAAQEEGHQGYYNFIYQNGGCVLSEDKKKSGFDLPETKQAIQFDVDLIHKEKISPTQQQFADTKYESMFESGKVAMGLFGSWMVSEFKGNEYVLKNCDATVIPQGKKRATIYNGLGNVIAANTKHKEECWKFLEFMGTEEANKIQAEKGAAIPAFKGAEKPWIEFNKEFNLKVYPEMLAYGVPMPTSKTRSKWEQIENDILRKVWIKEISVEEGCNQIAKEMNELLSTEK